MQGFKNLIVAVLALNCIACGEAKLKANASQKFCGGDGSAEAPFLICTVRQLSAIDDGEASGKYFRLNNDIDLAGFRTADSKSVIGGFSGYLDGAGFSISNYGRPSPAGEPLISSNLGLIQNLTFSKFSVQSNATGAFIGQNFRGEVRNVIVSDGLLKIAPYDTRPVGLLAAYNQDGTISGIHVKSVTIVLTGIGDRAGVGVVAGYNIGGSIEHCTVDDAVLEDNSTGGWFRIGSILGIQRVTAIGIVDNNTVSNFTINSQRPIHNIQIGAFYQ